MTEPTTTDSDGPMADDGDGGDDIAEPQEGDSLCFSLKGEMREFEIQRKVGRTLHLRSLDLKYTAKVTVSMWKKQKRILSTAA
jgi:hypothetical protein